MTSFWFFSTKSVKEIDTCHQLIFTWLVNSSWNRLQQKDFYLGFMIMIYGEELVINRYEKDKYRLKVATCHLLWDLNFHNAPWSMQRCWIMTIIIRLMHKTAGSDMISLVGNEQTRYSCVRELLLRPCLGENWSNQGSKQMEFIWEFQINPARWPDMNLLVRWEAEGKLEVKKHYFSQPCAIGASDEGFSTIALWFRVQPFSLFSLVNHNEARRVSCLIERLSLGCRDSMSPDLFKLIKKSLRGTGWGRGCFAMDPWISFEVEPLTSEGNEIVISKFPKVKREEQTRAAGESLSDVTFLETDCGETEPDSSRRN